MIKRISAPALALVFLQFFSPAFSAKDTPLGRLDLSASLTGIYDSRVFGISSNLFNYSRAGNNANIPSDELDSEDDFIVKFSPALHLSKKISLLRLTGSAGVEIAQFLKNSDKSYVIPITTLILDFDETLSKSKRISNNAKIRFDATFDVGQQVGASVLEQDLVSYTYLTTGINVRYNHSSKFGVGAGTNYTYQWYQKEGSTAPRPYNDLSTLPLHARAFYIYSEKLDLFTQYTYSRSQSHNAPSSQNLADSVTNSLTLGVNGEISPKLSGTASIGYSHLSFDNALTPSQNSLISSLSLSWKYNQKTSSTLTLDRSFSPSAQGFSNLSTFARFNVNHRFLEDLTGIGYLSIGHSEYTYPAGPTKVGETSSFDSYGFGISVLKRISKVFSASGGYDFSFVDRGTEDFARHVLQIQMTGRF